METEKIARLLPEIYQATSGRAGPLDGFLAAQEELHAPCETAIDCFSDQLNPRLAKPVFVYMLARWVDLDYLLDGPPQALYFAAGVGRLRELIATAAVNGRSRGTAKTMKRMLETATGCSGFQVETAQDGTFHVRITVPEQARTFRSLILRIVEAEKPAFATFELQDSDEEGPTPDED